MGLSSFDNDFEIIIINDHIKHEARIIYTPIFISIIPGLNIINIPIKPIISADILMKYIFSLKIITASNVTIKGTIKWRALNCSNDM